MLVNNLKKYLYLDVGPAGAQVDGDYFEDGSYFLTIPEDGLNITGDFDYRHKDYLILDERKQMVRNINDNNNPDIFTIGQETSFSLGVGEEISFSMNSNVDYIIQLTNHDFLIKMDGLYPAESVRLLISLVNIKTMEDFHLIRIFNDDGTGGQIDRIHYTSDSLYEGALTYTSLDVSELKNLLNDIVISEDLAIVFTVQNRTDAVVNFLSAEIKFHGHEKRVTL